MTAASWPSAGRSFALSRRCCRSCAENLSVTMRFLLEPRGRAIIGFDGRSKGLHCSVEAGLRGPDRDAHGLRRIREGQVEVVDEDDDGALLGRDPGEATLELVADGETALATRNGRLVARRHPDLESAPTLGAPDAVEAGPHEEAADPHRTCPDRGALATTARPRCTCPGLRPGPHIRPAGSSVPQP